MASKTSNEKCGTQLKRGKAQEIQNKLAVKLQLDLERDILRLFHDSLYCDIKLTVNSSSILIHSCILKARACRFYKFIYAEFEVLKQNGIQIFNIYNASFTYLQSFVENIYTNIHTTKAEDCIIKHLQETKAHSFEQNKLEISSNALSLKSELTPESDLFFTPHCSPSELKTAFAPSNLKIKDKNVVSYYKIVSVDDIPIDDKLEESRSKEDSESIGDKLLEKELAEQDELFSSFKTIFLKKNKVNTNSLSLANSSQSAKKTKPKLNKKFESNALIDEDHDKSKHKLPLWKPNPVTEFKSRPDKYSAVKTQKKNYNSHSFHLKYQEKQYLEEVTNSLCSSDMDVSIAGGDSGLDNSSICQPETSPRENTVSETSGIDLTEAATNEEIPDETISTKQIDSTGSSVSSEVGTWDTHDDFKVKPPLNNNMCPVEPSIINDHPANLTDNLDENEFAARNNLNEEEMLRLDEMDKQIRDCEIFLFMERQSSCGESQTDKGSTSKLYHSSTPLKVVTGGSTDEDNCKMPKEDVAYQYAEKENEMTNPMELLHAQTDHRLNNDEKENYYPLDDCNVEENLDDSVASCNNSNNNVNLMNEHYEVPGANKSLKTGASRDTILNSEFDFFTQSDSDILNLKRTDIQETKTPPCTPKKMKMESIEPDKDEKSEIFSEVKANNLEKNNSRSVGNYFIDASSLLDEDEIISPPLSLINFKSIQSCEEPESKVENEEEPHATSKKVVSNFFAPDDTVNETNLYLKEKERWQGDIIFKNSIPHFSKHEVDEKQILETTERLRGGADQINSETIKDDFEQVVPVTDVPAETREFREPSYSISNRQNKPDSSVVESHFFEPEKYLGEHVSESEEGDHTDGSNKEVNGESQANISGEGSVKDFSSSSICSGSPSLRRNELAPIISGGMDFIEDNQKELRKPNQSQGEAWIVTFDDKKPKNRHPMSFETNLELENLEDKEPVYKSYCEPRKIRKNEPFVELYVSEKKDGSNQEEFKEKPKAYPVGKSSSLGYFLDFGKQADLEPLQKEVENPAPKVEKKNMFSMFIGMDDDSKPTFSRKPKPVLEKENTFSKSVEETPNESSSAKSNTPECSEDAKKSFYMFIESDSPVVKRKPMPKKLMKSNAEGEGMENSSRRKYIRTQSYTIDPITGDKKESKPEVRADFECSSSDNSLPFIENDFKPSRLHKGRLPLPTNKLRSAEVKTQPKFTAWTETKVPENGTDSYESWLKTKDVQVNYTGKSDEYKEDLFLKKDSTFVMGNEYKGKYYDKNSHQSSTVDFEDINGTSKPSERDSGVILSEKSVDNFVKLSDMDSSDNLRAKQPSEKLSQSISEKSNRKNIANGDTPLSKSIGSEGVKSSKTSLHDSQISQSLSRLFPNLSSHSLASVGKKDAGDKLDTERSDIQVSETSEVSSSLQSSVEPSALEISTSETDVSTHVGTTSRLGEDLLKMFLEEISPDVVVEVGGRRIKAHKCILSSRCQYFAAMLSGGWVESAGNVISLQGFSYNAIHFALRHIYSGESRIPESLNIVELATLADMLCLDGLQEIISYNLKVKYCHSFHVPCAVCSVGVIDCLPIAAAYGLDDLYRKCLRWITKYFVKLWPTKNFGSLPKELLEKCYQHYVVHMTVDNVLDTIVNIDKVRGSLPNVRWAESVSRLVNKLYGATIRYIADHFSSVLTSDNFLALGKEAAWNLSRLEDSLMETIRYLPPEQACWSHARLHRILSIATGPDPPPEMYWNENFLKLLQVIAELVENSLIKQAPRAAKSKAWKQMEPELRSRIQEAACLVLPEEESSLSYRRSNYVKREINQSNIPPTAKSRNLEIRQIKLAMSQQASRNLNTSRPLSLQIDQRSKKDSRFVPLRPSASTSSVRKTEPMETIRATQSRSQILGIGSSDPKKNVNPRYSDVKSRYLEPRSPQKSASDKCIATSKQRRTFRYISSSDSSRNCSPALRPSNSRASIPQVKQTTNRQHRDSVLRSDSTTTIDSKRSFASARSDTPSTKTLSRLTADENMSTDSLYTDSLLSDKEATLKRRPETKGKENTVGRRKPPNPATASKSKVSYNSPSTRRLNSENLSSTNTKTTASKKFIMPTPKPANDTKVTPPKRFSTAKTTVGNQSKPNPCRSNAISSPRTSGNRNQRNAGKYDSNLVNGNSSKKRNEVDSENNKKNAKEPRSMPSAVSRSGTFLKDEPTILKKPQPDTVESEV